MASHRTLPTHWAVAVPVMREGFPEGVRETLKALSEASRGSPATGNKKRKHLAELSQFDVPAGLHVGTLDDLLRLADQLEGVTAHSEQCLRLHEQELVAAAVRTADGVSRAAAAASAAAPQPLLVDGVPVHEWIRRRFRWDTAQFDPREPLHTVLDRVRGTVATLDKQRRDQVQAVHAQRAALERAGAAAEGGLLAKPLAWLLSPAVLAEAPAGHRFFDCGAEPAGSQAAPLRTEFVVVAAGKEAEWLSKYESVGRGAVRAALEASAAEAGGSALAEAAPPSPVVPRSAFRLLQGPAEAKAGRESLWAVHVLSGFAAEFRAALARECRGVAAVKPDMDEDPVQRRVIRARIHGSSPEEAAEAEAEAARVREDSSAALVELQARLADAEARLLRECQARYEEAVRTHLHCVAVHLFAESVLRYGLPATFAFAVVRPKTPADATELLGKLSAAYGSLASPDDDADAPSGAQHRGNALAPGLPLAHVVADVFAEARP